MLVICSIQRILLCSIKFDFIKDAHDRCLNQQEARLAQLVERRTLTPVVVGSIPTASYFFLIK